MAIRIIDTLATQNNNPFPIALANDIKGGLHSVSSIEERNSISTQRLQNGMLCYVENDKMYQYINGEWIEFYSGSPNSLSTYIVDTYEEMLSLDEIALGTICYVKETEDINLYYFSEDGWKSFSTGDNVAFINELAAVIEEQRILISQLESRVEALEKSSIMVE